MFKGHFKVAASKMETAADAGHLIQASTHWLRHTHATHALEAGAEIEEADGGSADKGQQRDQAEIGSGVGHLFTLSAD